MKAVQLVVNGKTYDIYPDRHAGRLVSPHTCRPFLAEWLQALAASPVAAFLRDLDRRLRDAERRAHPLDRAGHRLDRDARPARARAFPQRAAGGPCPAAVARSLRPACCCAVDHGLPALQRPAARLRAESGLPDENLAGRAGRRQCADPSRQPALARCARRRAAARFRADRSDLLAAASGQPRCWPDDGSASCNRSANPARVCYAGSISGRSLERGDRLRRQRAKPIADRDPRSDLEAERTRVVGVVGEDHRDANCSPHLRHLVAPVAELIGAASVIRRRARTGARR